ncbi:MAG: hypothetical protein AAEJ53_03825 [Myxococcota bacterium]
MLQESLPDALGLAHVTIGKPPLFLREEQPEIRPGPAARLDYTE